MSRRSLFAMVMVVGAVAVWAGMLLRSSEQQGAAVYPPPFASDVAKRVIAAHAKDAAAAGADTAPAFVEEVAALERAEDANEPSAMHKTRGVSRSAQKVRANLGPDGWRALTSKLAVQAVDKVEASPEGAFFMRVLQPTGVLDAQGEGIGEGWQGLAEVLHRVRILRLGLSPNDDPENLPLSDDEKRLYYRWKIERATQSTRVVRLGALRRVLMLDPQYPAAEAEKHIIRGE